MAGVTASRNSEYQQWAGNEAVMLAAPHARRTAPKQQQENARRVRAMRV
jgi:hypothetical protein